MFGIGGGAGANGASSGSINSTAIDVAVAELDMITDVFNRLVRLVFYGSPTFLSCVAWVFIDYENARFFFYQLMSLQVLEYEIRGARLEQGRERLH